MATQLAATTRYLVRYGAIPEVARCHSEIDGEFLRGEPVVLETHRGLQIGSIVQALQSFRDPTIRPFDAPTDAAGEDDEHTFAIVRPASVADMNRQHELRRDAEQQFPEWVGRIRQWNVDVQLIDLEWTFDRAKLILYVLNERGPECTKLAIQAAAAGMGTIEVQPVSKDGLVTQPETGGGCGSGGCGCHS